MFVDPCVEGIDGGDVGRIERRLQRLDLGQLCGKRLLARIERSVLRVQALFVREAGREFCSTQ